MTSKLLAVAALAAISAHSAISRAYPLDEILACYQAGYDDSYADDWFYEYYEFESVAAEVYYADNSGFDSVRARGSGPVAMTRANGAQAELAQAED